MQARTGRGSRKASSENQRYVREQEESRRKREGREMREKDLCFFGAVRASDAVPETCPVPDLEGAPLLLCLLKGTALEPTQSHLNIHVCIHCLLVSGPLSGVTQP